TYERIAEIENRIQSLPYRQVPDSLDFQLVRARLAARQGTPREAVQNFSRMVSEHKYVSEASARYGLVFALLRANDLKRAGEELPALQALARDDPMVASLAAEVNVKRGAIDQGLAIYKTALGSYPSRNSLAYGYARALIGLGRYRQAADFVTDRIEDGQEDARLYELQAQAYAALGKKLAHHRAQAEAYLLRGNLRGAIEQLQIAKAAGDGDFYQQSAVEARLKELMQLDTEQHRKN
ncbi:MAG TPA: tetratricopeptide repeat protein, partial [Burkholderiales bacterium]|nr:tetratricopeptide repeat protein [Burkholderiales bacterium]